jgi:molybdate transport system substrate-binding protein
VRRALLKILKGKEMFKKFAINSLIVFMLSHAIQSEPLPNNNGKAIFPNRDALLVHCAAGMRKPIELCAKKFEDSLGIKVELSYDGSNRLLGQIELTRKGDVYICGDAEYADSAMAKGLVDTMNTICWFTPVILVGKGNPHKIEFLNDLTKSGIKIGQGDERSAAIGKIIRKLLTLNSVDQNSWKNNVVLITPTVTELGNAVKLGTVDAVIVWNSIALSYKDIGEIIPIVHNAMASVEAVALSTSANKPAARTFIDFLKGKTGRKILTDAGYVVDKR